MSLSTMSGSPPFEELELPRTLVLSTDPLVRDAFASLLVSVGIEVVDGESAADVALVDGGADPERAAERLGRLATIDVPFVALVPDDGAVHAALALGASGVLLRVADGARLHAALAAVHHGLSVVDAPLSEAALRASRDAEAMEPIEDLTAREREVLALLADGLSNKRIARRLEISEHTAKFHIGSILDKLGVSTRTEAVVTAARRGLLML
jgi:DNA-binding NarL/FixJ family response regulator